MKIIDAHSHIDYISHRVQPDVVGTVCCTTNEDQWAVLINMMQQDDKIYGAFGIHPWFIENIDDDFDLRLKSLLKTNRLYMVGEIGLDKYKPDMERQIIVFKKQMDIAVALKRNVFIHCVGAWDKMLHVLKQYKKSEMPKIIVHDFNGSDEIMDYLCDNYNVLFSFGKIDKSHEISRIGRLDNKFILVETDGDKNVVLNNVVHKIQTIKNDDNIANVIYNNTVGVINNE